jgi:hypothetical protein
MQIKTIFIAPSAEELVELVHRNIENLPPQPTNTAKATSLKLELARVADSIEVLCHKFLPSYLGACHAHEITAKRGDEALEGALQHAFVTLAPTSYGKPIIMNYHQARELAVALRTIAKKLGDTIEFGEDCPLSITETCEELYWAIADACFAEPVIEETPETRRGTQPDIYGLD